MARTQARIHSSIWTDPDWKALGRGAKLTYVLLLSQPTLSLAGCLDYMPERWAKYDPATDEDEILEDVEELERAGFVVVDWDTYEVLIRTFPANDLARGALNTNLVKGMWAAWAAILSPVLRRALLENLPAEIWDRLDKDDQPIRPAAAERMRSEPAIEAPSDRGRNGGSDGGYDHGSDGEPNQLLTADCCLLTAPAGSSLAHPDQSPTLSLVPVALPAPSVQKSKADLLFDEFWQAYPLKKGKKPARARWDKALKEGNDPAAIIAGAHQYRREMAAHPDPRIKFPEGWLNAERWNDEAGPAPQPQSKRERTQRALIEGATAVDQGAPTFAERFAAAGGQPAIEAGLA